MKLQNSRSKSPSLCQTKPCSTNLLPNLVETGRAPSRSESSNLDRLDAHRPPALNNVTLFRALRYVQSNRARLSSQEKNLAELLQSEHFRGPPLQSAICFGCIGPRGRVRSQSQRETPRKPCGFTSNQGLGSPKSASPRYFLRIPARQG